jgi:hypothetical protein
MLKPHSILEEFLPSHLITLLGLLLLFNSLSAQTTSLVRYRNDGTLSYTPDSKGNVLPDFSAVGYQNSEQRIPKIPLVKTLSPAKGDNTSAIQKAIAEVAAMPIQANGFRGAILFKAGDYPIQQSIEIITTGIVLYGEGSGENGTQFIATGTKEYDLITFRGSGRFQTDGAKKQVASSYVPIGSKKITIEGEHQFKPGDWIDIHHVVNQAWIKLLKMDDLSKNSTEAKSWEPEEYNYNLERKIERIEGNTLYLDAPVCDPIDPQYAKAYVSKIIASKRIENCGIENIRFTSRYKSDTDEDHGWTAVTFDNAKNCWARNLEAYYFGYSCVYLRDGALLCTVDSCKQFDPKSISRGGRKYSFGSDGQRNLVKNCYARGGRHDFVTGSHTTGPNVFLNCKAEQVVPNCDSGPHHRWSTLTLYDNLVTDMDLNVQNRRSSGSGHGWAGAQNLLWNCRARNMIVQNPPAPFTNWAIGCTGNITNLSRYATEPLGFVESKGTPIRAIPSLFEAQLKDRLKR